LAFVTDAESEAVPQGVFLEKGPCAVLCGNIAKAMEYLSESRSPRVLVVDIIDVAMPVTEVPCLTDVRASPVFIVILARNEVGRYDMLLEHLAERTGLERLQGMISVLNRSIKFGTPSAKSLRWLIAGARMVRISRLDERGARLSATLLLPVMVFILPYLSLVIGEPIGLQAADAFSGAFERVTASP